MYVTYPATRAIRTAEPTLLQEPITVAEARYQCGVHDSEFHDPAFQMLIPAARQQVEHDAEVICYTGTFTWRVSRFPNREWIELPAKPVTALTSIAYVATDGTSTTWPTAEYALDIASVVPIVRLAYGYSWPLPRGDMNGITVTFTAGYATVLAIPQSIKLAVLLALHVQWLLRMENPTEAAKQQVGYDRQIELIRRSVYV